MKMKIDILTLFPDMVKSAYSESIIARAIAAGYLDINAHQIRQYTENKQGKVDDCPFGGGPGMVMSYQPIASAIKDVCSRNPETKPYVIYMSPQGTVLTQKVAKRLAEKEHLVILCGHYEGVDERVIEDFIDEEISIGDYVLTGGEMPAVVLMDTVSRLIPGVLSTSESYENESHSSYLLEYPQYTRPAQIGDKKVPAVLLSGNHADCEKWRLETQIERTKKKRPDLYEKYQRQIAEESQYYFDNSATTRQDDEVTKEMNRVAIDFYGNPSSLHHLGFVAEKELKKARKTVADVIGADEDEIIFTASGSESNNTALFGYLRANPRKGKHIIVSAIEHPSVLQCAQYLEETGYEVTKIGVDSKGLIKEDDLKNAIREDTALVSIMHVNSETGVIQDLQKLAAIVKAANPATAFHADCVQSFCKLPINVKLQGIDMLSASGHKIHGPRGVGVFYKAKNVKLTPLIFGGGQEQGLRSGTENLPAICALAKACELYKEKIDEKRAEISEIKAIFTETIKSNIRSAVIVGQDAPCSDFVLNVAFPGLRAEVILHTLEGKGIYVSVGSACSSHKKNRSYVLAEMGYNNETIDGSIRLSFGLYNTKEQAQKAAGILVADIKRMYGRRKGSRN